MEAIRHYLVIKTSPEKVYNAVTTREGIESWWCKNTTAKPEVGFVNVFTFGKDRSEMKVTELVPNKRTSWECINAIDEWIGTRIVFQLEEKDGNTLVRFAQEGWRRATDTFAECNYFWALFMKSLKSYCETGAGSPS